MINSKSTICFIHCKFVYFFINQPAQNPTKSSRVSGLCSGIMDDVSDAFTRITPKYYAIGPNIALITLNIYFLRDKHIDTITKAAYKLSNHLLDIVNATKIYTMVPSWGYKDPNSLGGWNGMLGQLHQGEADIGL